MLCVSTAFLNNIPGVKYTKKKNLNRKKCLDAQTPWEQWCLCQVFRKCVKKPEKKFAVSKLPAVCVTLPPALAFRFLPGACDEPRHANRNYIK